MNQKSPLGRNSMLPAVLGAAHSAAAKAHHPPAKPTPPAAQHQLPPSAVPTPAPRQPSPIVRQIEIQYAGPATLSRQRILTNMKTTVGQPYSETTVEDDVRALYATGLVTNVRIYGEPLPDGVKVIVVVQTRVTLAAVNVVGNERVKISRIRKEMALKINAPLDEQTLETARQKVVELYQKRGYPDIDVQYKAETNEDRGTATVTYSVSEGTKAIVKKIRFSGNTAINSKRLKKEMKTKENNLIAFLTGAGRLNSAQLDEDVQKIKALFQDNAYEDVQITDVKINRDKGPKYVDIDISIDQGTQYHINAVTVD